MKTAEYLKNPVFPLSLSRLSGGAVCPNSSSSSSTTQNKEVPGVQMGPRHSRRQTPHADIRHRPQHVCVIACHFASVCAAICQPLFWFIIYLKREAILHNKMCLYSKVNTVFSIYLHFKTFVLLH